MRCRAARRPHRSNPGGVALTLYEILKYIHIVMAIAAIGFNLSYAFWLARAEREPEHAAHLLRGIKILDDRFANPAYGVLLVTGIIMVLKEDLGFDTFWIASALVLYVLVTLVAILVYSPTLRNQALLAEANKTDSDEYKRLFQKGKAVGVGLVLGVLVIEFLMVTKPTL